MGTNAAHFTEATTEAQKRRPERQRHPAPKPSSTRPRGCPPRGASDVRCPDGRAPGQAQLLVSVTLCPRPEAWGVLRVSVSVMCPPLTSASLTRSGWGEGEGRNQPPGPRALGEDGERATVCQVPS